MMLVGTWLAQHLRELNATAQWTEVVTLCCCLLSSFRILYLLQSARYTLLRLHLSRQNGASREIGLERLRRAKERFLCIVTLGCWALLRVLLRPAITDPVTYALLEYGLPALFSLTALYVFLNTELELRGRDRILRYLAHMEEKRREAEEKSLRAYAVAQQLRQTAALKLERGELPPDPAVPTIPAASEPSAAPVEPSRSES